MKKVMLAGVYAFPLVAVVGLAIFFSRTDPSSVGPVGILGVFVTIYLICLDLIFLLVHGGLRVLGALLAKARLAHPKAWRVGVRKAYYIASVVAFGPVFLLAVSTLGQLQVRDVALVVIFLALAVVYVLKRE